MSNRLFDVQYELMKPIGHQGSYGEVRSVLCRQTNRELAVKIMKKPTLIISRRDQTQEKLLRAEVAIMSTIQHPHIVNVVDVLETETQVFLVMEICRGGDLFDRIMAYGGRMPEHVAQTIFTDLLDAVQHIHSQGIVHGDLKLSNIMFDGDGDDGLRVIDFGMSQFKSPSNVLNEMVGTPNYQSPDVINGGYSFPSDIWSLGVILFVMVFGFNPFDPFGANDQPHVVHQRILGGFLPSVNPGYGAWFPADIQASDTVVDLITRLLCSSPTRRLSLKQARKHPWITGIGTETMAKRDRAGKSADSFNTLSPCA